MPLIFSGSELIKQISDRAAQQRILHFNTSLRHISHQFYTTLSAQGIVVPSENIAESAEKGLTIMERLFDSITDTDKFFIHLAAAEVLKNLITQADDVPISDTLKKVQHWLASESLQCFRLDMNKVSAGALLEYMDYMTRAYISIYPEVSAKVIRTVLQPARHNQP